ncbi:MAG: RIP metalloprotease RseP [Phycisphaerae bacterium]|nr:RIP metalloprotease RseP [Phycisphaerae bacterium]
MPNVIYAVLGFGFIIFIHELGHFVAAKLFGVKVEAFSMGFPPTLLHHKVGETDYRIGIVPLGGYVSMLGEDPREPQNDPRALCNIRPWKRIVVFLAGVLMNVATAMVIYMAASFIGIQVIEPVVGGVADGSPAQAAGLQPGDRIVEMDGKRVASFEEIRQHIAVTALDDINHGFRIRYQRDGEPVRDVSLKAAPGDDGMPVPSIGIMPPVLPQISDVADRGPALDIGFRKDDRITAVDGRPVRFTSEVADLTEDWPKRPITFTVSRDGMTVDLTADPAKVTVPDYGLDPALALKAVVEDGVADKAGLKAGDRIVRVNDIDLPTSSQVSAAIRDSKGEPVRLVVRREGQAEPLSVTVVPQWDDGMQRHRIGVSFASHANDTPVMRRYGAAGPAATIPDGARIAAFDGKTVKTWLRLYEYMAEANGRTVDVAYTLEDGTEKFLAIAPARIVPEIPWLGAGFGTMMQHQMDPIYNPLAAFNIGVKEIASKVWMQYVTIKALVRGTVPAREVSGPLRIGVVFYESSKMGVSTFMMLLGLVSVAIALMNAMPIPPLDGGHVVFVLAEKFLGRPVPVKVRGALTMAGTVLLLSIVAFAFFNDGRYILTTYLY